MKVGQIIGLFILILYLVIQIILSTKECKKLEKERLIYKIKYNELTIQYDLLILDFERICKEKK